MKEPDLLPCPLCGGDDFKLSWGGTHTAGETPKNNIIDITCTGCGLRLWGNYHPVTQRWNTRKDLDATLQNELLTGRAIIDDLRADKRALHSRINKLEALCEALINSINHTDGVAKLVKDSLDKMNE